MRRMKMQKARKEKKEYLLLRLTARLRLRRGKILDLLSIELKQKLPAHAGSFFIFG